MCFRINFHGLERLDEDGNDCNVNIERLSCAFSYGFFFVVNILIQNV